MGARSAVKRLPDNIRGPLEGWLNEFHAEKLTLDEVMTRLGGLLVVSGVDPAEAPSRSAVHRHAQSMEKVVERIQRSRQLTDALAEKLGPSVADGRGVQVMIAAVQGLAYDLLGHLEDGTSVDPKAIHDLAKAADHMASAQKKDADRALKVEQETLKKAAREAAAVGKEMGWSAETARAVRERILGIGKSKGDGG